MGTHKNIGKAVKEKMASYQDAPDVDLWARIEETLGPEKKKRRFPVWWWLTGGILLGIVATTTYINIYSTNNSNLNTNPVVIVDQNPQNSQEQKLNNHSSETFINQNRSLNNDVIDNNRQDSLPLMNSSPKSIISTQSISTFKESNAQKNNIRLADNNDTISKSDNELAMNQNHMVSNKQDSKRNSLLSNDSSNESSKEQVAIENVLKKRRDSIKAINEKKRQQRIEKRKMLADLKNEQPKDSTNNDIDILKPTESPWSVTASGIVTHYQNLNNGNSLDPAYDDYLIEDRISLNYGASLNFITNDYLQLRIGVNHMRFNQTTKSIPADFNQLRDLQYVSYEVEDGAIASFLASDASNIIEIDHDLNYIEIPLEVRLRLNNGNLEVSTIFGISYMILIDQYFTARNSNQSLRFGRATFINDSNFNVNAGFGLRYPLYNRFYLNTDFMFKYQIKTYSQTRDIDPAYFNLQIGIEYKL